jgi:hypothetical protein
MIKRISVLMGVFAVGAALAFGTAAADTVDQNGCVLNAGNHCKRLAKEAETTTGTPTTTSGTTTTTTTTTSKTTSNPTTQPTAASNGVSLVDREWVCPGPVDITGTVQVTIDANGSGDAVKLSNDCTGYINRIVVTQYQGDGMHITNAHNLTIGSILIRCYGHAVGKHQDGVQVMGGSDVTINNADIGCYSANNSQVWINRGAGGNGPGGVPTNIIFNGGHFQGYFNNGQFGPGGSYGVSIGDSVGSGFRNAVICPNAHTARQLNIMTSAASPVDVSNQMPSSC